MKISSSSLSPLNGKTFVLELSRDIRFKAKQELINYLREQNAQISYILTASTDYILVSNDVDTYKTRRAKQLGIPLVNVEYIYECRNLSIGKEAVDIKRYIVTSAEDKENFSKNGTIPVSGGGSSATGMIKPVKMDLSKMKIWNSDDVELPRFDEITHAEIGKWAIFKETNDHSDIYFVLEVQIIPEEYYNQTTNDYRLRFRYEKQTTTSSKGKNTLIQYAFSNDVNELQQLFASYYNRIGTMPRITRIRDLLPDKLGSKLLLRSLFLHRIDTQMLDDDVCQLIESLWIESIGDLSKILSVQPESIALKTIIEAEAALLEIKSDSKSSSEAESRFYSLIPHRSSFVVDLLTNRRALIDKTDLCQMLRDMLTVNELTNWNIKASIEAKYRALKCHIETLGHDSQEYRTINEMIMASTNLNEKVIVHQIYSVAKQTDALNFRSTLFNQKQLFHGSKYNNFLGILSRGLLMPKMVVNDLGITRTDIGCLGYGIYFSDSVSTSLKYTTPSTTRPGRRLLCISQVALGDSAKFYSYSSTITQPPENFHSTHGVKKTNENNSKFVDDEYAIYNLDQQRLLYIVELSWTPFDDHNQSLKPLSIIRDSVFNRLDEIDIPSTIEDEVIQVAEQDYGLICPSSGQLLSAPEVKAVVVPLKAFHIRAQLVDVIAEVVLYQVYSNTSSVPIEAKYVFPLDENCSVCGFEAHINNKIIKGVVKEKEQAKREYREAIEQGHGAYLMHQEQPEVFSVSVGNLPANCEVIIKITYVAELSIENNDIIFRLPAKVASWQSKQALEIKDQTLLPSITLDQENSSMKSVEFSLKTSIRMPYEIVKLFSPTHRLRRKITDCIAMIELVDNILFEKDFLLSITLKSVNLPRMLNETDEENSQACMLTFYPKFETMNNSNDYAEIVFLIDVSNSMDGKHVQQAKQLAHLFLTNMKQNDGSIYFNIVTFGSDNDECFPISLPNTKENLDKAKHFILHSLDHRGNTDLFSVLRQYSLLPSSSKLGRQFLLLSDGHITDLPSTLTLLQKQSSMRHDRLFTCSIGETSNKHNLKQLANQANGGGLNIVFDSNYRSRWKTKVLQILEYIHQPCVRNISIDWHGTIDERKFPNQAPKSIRSLFNGMRLTVYRFIENCHKARLTAMINDQEFVTDVFSNKMTESQGRILHCLTARTIIQDYENGLLDNDESENELIRKQFKQDLIDLSIKYSVVCSFTSFVAIEERDGQELESGVRLVDVMLENDMDLLPYISWDGERSQMDLIKDRLINAKRLFDNASISNKIQLTNEYEDLCKNISYRSGGDAKYELMLTIIDTYRTVLKEKEKVRELEEKMKNDLINEIKNTTADERKVLEKRLNEINIRFELEELGELDDHRTNSVNEIDLFEELFSTADNTEMYEDFWKQEYAVDECQDFDPFAMPGMALQQAPSKPDISPAPAKTGAKGWSIESDDDDEGDDMGFGLFDDGIPSSSYKASIKPEKKLVYVDDDEDEEGDDMGFGLFGDDDDILLSALTTSVEQDKKSVDDQKKVPQNASKSAEAVKLTEQKKDKESMTAETKESSSLYPMMRRRSVMLDTSLSSESSDDISVIPTVMLKPVVVNNTSKTQPTQHLLQLQQQQQQQQQQMMFSSSYAPTSPSYSPASPSYSPTSPRYSPGTIEEESSVTWNASNSEMQRERDRSPANVSRPQLFSFPTINTISSKVPQFGAVPSFGTSMLMAQPRPFSPVANTVTTGNIPTSSTFTGFGGSAPSTTFASVPPPPPPGALFSFAGRASAPTTGFVSTTSVVTPWNISAPSSTFASIPPPPSVSTATAGDISTSSIFSTWSIPASSASATFGGLPPSSTVPIWGAPVPPPPPPSAPYPQGSLFSSASSSTNVTDSNTPRSFTSTGFGGSSAFSFAAPSPPPPPGLFGSSSSSSNKNIFGILAHRSDHGVQQMAMPPTFQPQSLQPSQTPTAAAGFTFGTTSTSTTANIAPTTTGNQSKLAAPYSPLISTKPRYDEFNVQSELEKSNVILEQDFSDVPQRHATITEFSSGRGRGRFSPGKRTVAPHPVDYACYSEHEETTPVRTDNARPEYLSHSVRFADTRLDEQERHHLTDSLSMLSTDNDDLHRHKSVSKKKRTTTQKFAASCDTTAIQDLLLLDVTPLGYGIEDINGHMCTIIERNRTIPLKTEYYSVFTNAYAYQTTATIRVFSGLHKLTKYNTFIGKMTLAGLTANFVSQVLEISIRMNIDANGLLEVEAEESRSGSKAKIRIDPNNFAIGAADLERHVTYVESDPDFRALHVKNRQANDPLYMLKGETENAKINFTDPVEISEGFPTLAKFKNIELITATINELQRIQSTDGSFDLNQDLADLLSTNLNNFDALKAYLSKQDFNSFAFNIQNEILRLIATGIILMEFFFQVPVSERGTYLIPFDREQIRSIFHRHLPKILLENVDRAIDFYEQKRRRYGIYCEQLELNYSTWEKFIQYSIFHIDN